MGDFLTRTDANPLHWAGDITGGWDIAAKRPGFFSRLTGRGRR